MSFSTVTTCHSVWKIKVIPKIESIFFYDTVENNQEIKTLFHDVFEGGLLVVFWLTFLFQMFFLIVLLSKRFQQNCQAAFKGIVGYSKTVAEFRKNQQKPSQWYPLLKYYIERRVLISIFEIRGATYSYGSLLELEHVLLKGTTK